MPEALLVNLLAFAIFGAGVTVLSLAVDALWGPGDEDHKVGLGSEHDFLHAGDAFGLSPAAQRGFRLQNKTEHAQRRAAAPASFNDSEG